MTAVTHPDKQVVRDWLKREVAAKRPPMSPEEVRRQLGWKLIENERTR